MTLVDSAPVVIRHDTGSEASIIRADADGPARATLASKGQDTALGQDGPEAPAAHERERVVISGRIGRPPVVGTTPKGQPKLTFQVAEHPTPDDTVWHHVVAFGGRAEQLRGTLRGGEPVEVVGYRHERVVRGRDGQPKTVAEIYATAVRSLSSNPTKQ